MAHAHNSNRRGELGVQSDVEGERSTRDRILDVALDLFIDKGFDKTSVREIAEQLGFTKAALYYHFASKDDILMALHLRLHKVGRQAIERIGNQPPGVETLKMLLDEMIGEMLANRRIFLLHERNRAAFEQLHQKDHDDEHDDLEQAVRRLISDPTVPLRERLRMGCAIGAVMTSLVFSGELLDEVNIETIGGLLREVVDDLLGRDQTNKGQSTRGLATRGHLRTRPSHKVGA